MGTVRNRPGGECSLPVAVRRDLHRRRDAAATALRLGFLLLAAARRGEEPEKNGLTALRFRPLARECDQRCRQENRESMHRLPTINARLRTAAHERGASPCEMAELDALMRFVSALDPDSEMDHHVRAKAAADRLTIAGVNTASWLRSRRDEHVEAERRIEYAELTEVIATLEGTIRFVEDAVGKWTEEASREPRRKATDSASRPKMGRTGLVRQGSQYGE